jgi:hypothetical protein
MVNVKDFIIELVEERCATHSCAIEATTYCRQMSFISDLQQKYGNGRTTAYTWSFKRKCVGFRLNGGGERVIKPTKAALEISRTVNDGVLD